MARLQPAELRFPIAMQANLAAVKQELIQTALRESAKIINGKPRPSSFTRNVDGVRGAPETAVKANGFIVYEFQYITEIVAYALQFLVERSPVDSGRYKRSWFVMVDGVRVSNPKDIQPGSIIMISNDQPYSRKIEVGHMRMSVPHGVVDDASVAVNHVFGNMIKASVGFVDLPGGYVLKGRFRRGYRAQARKKLRADTMAGATMTYPTLVIKQR